MADANLTFPITVYVKGATEDQYNKIYDILLQAACGGEGKDFDLYMVRCGLELIGLNAVGYIEHYHQTTTYGDYINDYFNVYTAEEFLAKFSDNISLENSSKNVRKRPNMQRSSSKCVIYYTDGSSYTINNFQEIVETDVTAIIGYIAPERKVMVERGVLITELSSHKNVEIDKEHLAGVVIKQQNGEDRVIRYSHLFASKQYVANQKNKMKAWSKRMKKAVERNNTNVDVSGDCPSEDGQSKDVQPTGYKLADGTYSSQYKIGDKFVVATSDSVFYGDSIVELCYDGGGSAPVFRLFLGGMTINSHKNTAHCNWCNLKAYSDVSLYKIAP